MALQSRPLNIPLIGGLTQKNGDVILEAPSFSQLDNVRFDKVGAIHQRYGFGKLTAETDPYAVLMLAKNDDALIGRGAAAVFAYQKDRETWTQPETSDFSALNPYNVHPMIPTDVSVSDLPGNVSGIVDYGFSRGSGPGAPECTAVCYDDESVMATIRAADGTLIVAPKKLPGNSGSNFQHVRVACLGTTFYVMASDAFWGTWCWTCDTSAATPVWGNMGGVTTGKGAFDLEVNEADSELIVAHWDATDVQILRLDAALSVVSTVNTGHTTAPTFISLRIDTGRILALYAGATADLYGASYSLDLGTTHFADTSLLTPTGTSVTHADAILVFGFWFLVWTERFAATGATAMGSYMMTTAGVTSGTVRLTYHVAQIGKMHLYGLGALIPAKCTLSLGNLCGFVLQSYGFGASFRLGVAARFMVDRCVGLGLSRSYFDDGVLAFVSASYQGATTTTSGTLLLSRLSSVEVLASAPCARFVEYDGVTYWGGGMLTAFDGQLGQELSPQWDPVIYDATAGTGGVLPAGDYSWKVVYEWDDARGVLHRSTPSPLITKTLTSSQACTLTVAMLDVTARDGMNADGVRVALYRTQKDGAVFYLVNASAPLTASATNGYWDVVDDSVLDADLGQTLYTEGNALPAGRTPPAWDLCLGGGRMWAISADRRSEVWFSKPLERTIAPEFDVSQVIDPGCGELMAIARMDDKTVVFSREQIFVIFGDGPNAAGVGGAFSQPQPIASDTGCLSRGSVCEGPFGVVFHGKRGLCLLTRGLDVVPIGDDVVDLVTADSVVTSAVLASDSDEVRFTLSTGGTIVWNHSTQQWGRWTGLGTQLHAVDWDDRYIVCDGTVDVREYDPAKYGDDYGGSAAGDELVARTGWVRVAGIHGYQRVRRIYITYVKNGTCGIKVKARFNNNVTTVTLRTVAASDLAAAGELAVHVPTQQCESIQVQIESDGAAAATGTLTIQALSLEIGAKNGGGRYAATARR